MKDTYAIVVVLSKTLWAQRSELPRSFTSCIEQQRRSKQEQ